MLYQGLDHVALLVSPEGWAPFEKLGLRLSPPFRLAGTGIERRLILTGARERSFGIALDHVVDDGEASKSALGRLALRGPGPRGPLYALVLGVSDMQGALRELAGRDLVARSEEVFVHGETKLCDVAVLPEREDAYAPLVLIEYARPAGEWYVECEQAGMLGHSLELTRLDHLATQTPDQTAACAFWRDVLGIPQTGELVGGSGNTIHQFKVGDAIVELIGAVSAQSPVNSRPPGLNSMTAFEVPDLQAAVATARAAGFTISDPAVGGLPGTHVSRIPAEELSGLSLQLLQYVQ